MKLINQNLHMVLACDIKDPLVVAKDKKVAMEYATALQPYCRSQTIISVENWLAYAQEHIDKKDDFKPVVDALESHCAMIPPIGRFELAYRIAAYNSLLPDDKKSVLFTSRYDEATISNPFMSACGRFQVNPIRYYGPDFINWFNGIDSLDLMPGIPSFEKARAMLQPSWNVAA